MGAALIEKDYDSQICKFIADGEEDLALMPTTKRGAIGSLANRPGMVYAVPMGSLCTLKDGSRYRLFSDGWSKSPVQFGSGSGSGSGNSGSGTGGSGDPGSSGGTGSGSGITTNDIDNMFKGISHNPATPDNTGDSGITQSNIDDMFKD